MLYVRQEAYYNAVPDGQKISRAEQIERVSQGIQDRKNKSDDDSESEEDLDDDPGVTVQELQEIPMPELSAGSEYLVAFLHSAGTATSNGMGIVGLSWMEIAAWVECADQRKLVTPRDLQTIHLLSKVYANELARASQKGAKAPYSTKVEMEEELRAIVEERVEDLFAGMMTAQQAGK